MRILIISILTMVSALADVNVTWVPSPNYNCRLDKATGIIITKPTILVLHYTVSDLNGTFEIFESNSSQVSSHYTVAEDGAIYQHVDEKFRAWHAGVGTWRDVKDVNTYSVGIEIVNAGYRDDPKKPPGIKVNGSTLEWYPFNKPAQIRAVIDLSKDIIRRYGIEPRNVIGHADLAPGRKEDPGPLFPWSTLAENGIGAFVNSKDLKFSENGSEVHDVQLKLRQYGFTMVPLTGKFDNDTRDGLVSFQMHFRQKNIGGKIDNETVSILDALLKKYDHSK